MTKMLDHPCIDCGENVKIASKKHCFSCGNKHSAQRRRAPRPACTVCLINEVNRKNGVICNKCFENSKKDPKYSDWLKVEEKIEVLQTVTLTSDSTSFSSTVSKIKFKEVKDKRVGRVVASTRGDNHWKRQNTNREKSKDNFYKSIPVNGVWVAEHRHVMEQYLKQPLENFENVHHKNGVRSDNRLENLELWIVHQPSGQRVEDRVADARWILARYGDMYPESRG